MNLPVWPQHMTYASFDDSYPEIPSCVRARGSLTSWFPFPTILLHVHLRSPQTAKKLNKAELPFSLRTAGILFFYIFSTGSKTDNKWHVLRSSQNKIFQDFKRTARISSVIDEMNPKDTNTRTCRLGGFHHIKSNQRDGHSFSYLLEQFVSRFPFPRIGVKILVQTWDEWDYESGAWSSSRTVVALLGKRPGSGPAMLLTGGDRLIIFW